MPDTAPLHELRELLAAFVERPLGGALVIGCHDADMLPLVHVLGNLDIESPADRFLLHFEPFTTPDDYVNTIVDHVVAATSHPSPPSVDALTRLRTLIDVLLADLPPGDHALVLVLAPTRIDDPIEFAALAEALLAGPYPHPLRLVLRDDLERPHHFLTASSSSSEQIIAYRFSMPAASLDGSAAIASNPNQPPGVRAQALLQLAIHASAHGHHDDAIAACEVAAALTDIPLVIALALIFRADALRAQGAHEPAHLSARLALDHAVACRATPVIHHAAMTLGELSQELGDPAAAAACFELAERTAPHNPEIQAIARDRRIACASEVPC